MFVLIIMLFVNIQILIAMHYTTVSSIKPNGNIILGLSIPTTHLLDERIVKICKALKKECKYVLLISLFANILMLPIYEYVSFMLAFVLIYFLAVMGIYNVAFNKYVKKLKELKIENEWYTENKNILSIDTEVSRIKDTFPMSRYCFLPSFMIIVCCMFYFDSLGLNIYSLIIFFTTVILYEYTVKLRSITYSQNSDINIVLNKSYKYHWTKCWIILSYSFVGAIPMFVTMDNDYYVIYSVISISIVSIITLIPMIIADSKIKKLRSKLLQIENKVIYVDDDEYWENGTYNNKNDSRIFIEKRVGIGTTINTATKWGKIINGSVYIVLGLSIVFVLSMVPYDFGQVNLVIDDDTIIISAPYEKVTIDKNDIVSIDILDTMPSAKKVMGTGTNRMRIGKYSVQDYGRCEIYIMTQVDKCIVIELSDEKYIFVNGENEKITEQYYVMIKDK